MRLVEEILLEPRFDPDEFELARQRVASTLQQRAASPVALAGDVFQRLMYGEHELVITSYSIHYTKLYETRGSG